MEKERPSWKIDLKWVFGILSVVVLLNLLFVFSFYLLTLKQNALPLMTNAVASLYSPKGLDDATDFEKAKADFLASGKDFFQPFPNMNITVSKNDLLTKTPRELRLQIFGQMVEPIYTGALPAQISASDREKFNKDSTILRILSAKTHTLAGYLLAGLSVFFILFFGLAIYFSYKLGKLVTMGVILLFTAFLPTILWGVLNLAAKSGHLIVSANLPEPERANELVQNTVPILTGLFFQIYLYVLLFGILMLLIALFGKIFFNKVINSKEIQ